MEKITSLEVERGKRETMLLFDDIRESLFEFKKKAFEHINHPEDLRFYFDYLKNSLKSRITGSNSILGYLEACVDEEKLSGYFTYSAELISILAFSLGEKQPFTDEESSFYKSIGVILPADSDIRSKIKLTLATLRDDEHPSDSRDTPSLSAVFNDLKEKAPSDAYRILYEKLFYILIFKITDLTGNVSSDYHKNPNAIEPVLRYAIKSVLDSDTFDLFLKNRSEISDLSELERARLKRELSEELFKNLSSCL